MEDKKTLWRIIKAFKDRTFMGSSVKYQAKYEDACRKLNICALCNKRKDITRSRKNTCKICSEGINSIIDSPLLKGELNNIVNKIARIKK